MKTKILILAVVMMGAIESKAQLSVAADIAVPMGDFGDVYGFAIGPSIGYDLNLGDMFTVFGQAGYDFLLTKSDYSDNVSGAYMIPYQAGLKINFGQDSEGLYGMAMLGGHTVGSKYSYAGVETTNSTSLFSWGLGGGLRKGNTDFGVRYNVISADKEIDNSDPSSYLGIRVGFFLGGN